MIDERAVGAAYEKLRRYKSDKKSVDERTIDAEEWWKRRHESGRGSGSAWLFNSVANKHADAMDQMPEAVILPREESDRETAEVLSKVIPCVLELSDLEEVYSAVWYDKLKYGTGCYGVVWDPSASGGAGEIRIMSVDVLNLFWEGGIGDIQKSPSVFHVELRDNEELKEEYPVLKEVLSSPDFRPSEYLFDDAVDVSDKSAVVDWYYKIKKDGRDVVHLCKFCCGKILFASENGEGYSEGFYAHGKYPFVFDRLYPVKGSPCGFGFIDIMKGTQRQIDQLGDSILENARMASKVRYFVRGDGSINEEEFADWSKPLVHVAGSRLGEDSLRQIVVSPLDDLYVSIMNGKISELKETTGNRDFTQGGTTGGITAASAIAALQEAGSKLSRDMIKGSYSAFSKVVSLVIELMREFYDEPRYFRITGEGGYSFVTFDSSTLSRRPVEVFGVGVGERLPVFDIRVSAVKQTPFAKASQNELAKEFFAMGFFDPGRRDEAVACLSMMDIEGKDALMARLLDSPLPPVGTGS